MNDWALARFSELRVELSRRGLHREYWPALRRLVSPDLSLTLYETIDRSNPGQWREALASVTARAEQPGLIREAANE